MNNQKGGWGIQRERSFGGGKKKKKVKKRSSLCSAGSLKSFLQQTLVYRHTQRHTGTLSLPLFSLGFSLSFLPLSSPPHPFIFTLGLLQGSPHVPQYLPLVCCPGFDICLQKDQQHTLDPFLQLPWL